MVFVFRRIAHSFDQSGPDSRESVFGLLNESFGEVYGRFPRIGSRRGLKFGRMGLATFNHVCEMRRPAFLTSEGMKSIPRRSLLATDGRVGCCGIRRSAFGLQVDSYCTTASHACAVRVFMDGGWKADAFNRDEGHPLNVCRSKNDINTEKSQSNLRECQFSDRFQLRLVQRCNQ